MLHNAVMRWGAVLWWSLVIYAASHIPADVIDLHLRNPLLRDITSYLVAGVVATMGVRRLGLHSRRDIITYSCMWAGLVASYDILHTSPFSFAAILNYPPLLILYAVIALAPLLAQKDMRSLRREE